MQTVKCSVSDDLRAWLQAEAERQSRSESSIIREALTFWRDLPGGKENGK